MTIFLVLAPYGAFAFLMLVTSSAVSLFAGAAICLAVIARDAARGRSLKILGAGSVVVFAGLGSYVAFVDPAVTPSVVRLAVDSGIFLISLTSMLARHPFTMQYALESVTAETAAMPGFVRANYVITGAWTVAMFLMMVSNVALLYVLGLPIWAGLLITVAARNSAVFFTKWYPAYREAKYVAAPANALPTT
jgi:hypothetical protein